MRYAALHRIAFALIVIAALQHVPNPVAAQGAPAGRAGGPAPASPAPPDPTRPMKLDLIEGTTARYKVREQLAGISFPSDAVGTTTAVTGTIVVNPDGSIDSRQSRLTVDLRTLTSDQSMRDGYVRDRTLETGRFPMMEFVPKRAEGLPVPVPADRQAQAGFKLIGDMTLRGVTREVTWTVVATLNVDQVSGRATTTFPFALFELTKPSLARLMSVDDDITLEIEFKSRRSSL